MMFYVQTTHDLPSADLLTWADGLVLVYSITDRNQYSILNKCFFHRSSKIFEKVVHKESIFHAKWKKLSHFELLYASKSTNEVLTKRSTTKNEQEYFFDDFISYFWLGLFYWAASFWSVKQNQFRQRIITISFIVFIFN